MNTVLVAGSRPECRGRGYCVRRGVDDQVFEVWIFDQRVENTLPIALLGPPAKALEHAVLLAELFRKVAPRCPCASQPEHGINKPAIVLAMRPLVAFLARNK
jgi:hypothetical protein